MRYSGKFFSEFFNSLSHTYFSVLFFNIFLLITQFYYVYKRLFYLSLQIPLLYSMPWGEMQLAPKNLLFIIPISTLVLIFFGIVFILFSRKYRINYGVEVILTFVTFFNIFLSYSLLRIVSIASIPHPSLVRPEYINLIIPFFVSFALVYLLTPKYISILKQKNIVTNPTMHSHPGMILVKPAARGGGLLITFVFIFVGLIFTKLSVQFLTLYLIMLLLAILGIIDDYQNTNPTSKARILEKPIIRLGLLFLLVLGAPFAGIKFSVASAPLENIFSLPPALFLGFNLHSLIVWSVTVLWIVWILNLLSWSNGVDGQYSGIVSIAGLVITILALRYTPVEKLYLQSAILSVILSGAGFGLLVYSWHPTKIMWGFGAMSAGFAIATLSILINSKIATTTMVVLVPFLDASITVIRRILQGKNPMVGDKGHLHHILLEKGWGVKKIAIFYWITTAAFGYLGIKFADKTTAQSILIIIGIAASFIVLMNLSVLPKKSKSQLSE